MDMWDSHKIRPSTNPVVPSGRPSHMYQFPSMWETTDYLTTVSQQDVQACVDSDLTKVRSEFACDDDVHRLCTSIMRTQNLEIPTDGDSALTLYTTLRQQVLRLL